MLNLKNDIHNEDWTFFNGHPEYDSKLISNALIKLLELNDSESSEDIADKLINAVGSNHEGTYYPVITKVIEYIIKIEQNSTNKVCKICSKAILNDLYYFEPDVTGYNKVTSSQLKKIVVDKLDSYSDENIKW